MATTASDESPARYSDGKEAKDFNDMTATRSASPFDDNNASYIGDYQPGSEAEKKLLRKLDSRIIVSH